MIIIILLCLIYLFLLFIDWQRCAGRVPTALETTSAVKALCTSVRAWGPPAVAHSPLTSSSASAAAARSRQGRLDRRTAELGSLSPDRPQAIQSML
jgi:hypothetical protein